MRSLLRYFSFSYQMAQQLESRIEDFAFDYLTNYYSQQYSTSSVVVGQHEKTKRGNSADGIVAVKHQSNEIILAAISMGQSERLTQLLTNYKIYGLGKLRLLTPVTILLACLFLGISTNNLWLTLVAPLPLAIAGFTVHSLILKQVRINQVDKLLSQVKENPANEYWIGLSISSLTFRNNLLAKKMLQLCQRKGIGLITVGKRAKVVRMHEPLFIASHNVDFLTKYESDAHIRKALLGDQVLRVA
jgi:hypothetical protein